jgi:Tfp pilus assembly protein PilV
MGAQLRTLETERGTTLIETVIATALLLVVMIGLLSMAAVATVYTENHGHLEARTTEYAQDKMEQLLALSYGDNASDTTVFPAAISGGTGLAVGGTSDAAATPAAKYVDYLDQNGNLLVSVGTTAPTGWFYKRVWAVAPAGTNLKQITVTATIARGFGGGNKALSVLTVLKTSPF